MTIPPAGGGVRLTSDGNGGYTVTKLTIEQPAADEYRAFTDSGYYKLSPLELMRRLHAAERMPPVGEGPDEWTGVKARAFHLLRDKTHKLATQRPRRSDSGWENVVELLDHHSLLRTDEDERDTKRLVDANLLAQAEQSRAYTHAGQLSKLIEQVLAASEKVTGLAGATKTKAGQKFINQLAVARRMYEAEVTRHMKG